MAGADAPTGCFKCGRTGHWSSDCPLDRQDQDQTHKQQQQQQRQHVEEEQQPASVQVRKRKNAGVPKQPRVRPPKLTVDMLLSDKGLGYVLEKLPRKVRIRGPGHEAEDLEGLLDAYKDWHASLLPSIPFPHFIAHVEALGSVRRVKDCLEDLRDKVAAGGDASLDPSTEKHKEDADSEVEEMDSQEKFQAIQLEEQQQALDKAQRERMEASRLRALEIRRARAQQQNVPAAGPE